MRFIQIHTLQLDLGIATMGAHQNVGVIVTGQMIFSRCIPFRSAWTLSVMVRGGRQGVAMEKGWHARGAEFCTRLAFSPDPWKPADILLWRMLVRVRSIIPESWRASIAGLHSGKLCSTNRSGRTTSVTSAPVSMRKLMVSHWRTFVWTTWVLRYGVDWDGRQVAHIFVVRWSRILDTLNSVGLVL